MIPFAQVRQAQATHERYVTGGGRRGAQTPQLRCWLTLVGHPQDQHGGHLSSFDHTKYAQRYLAGVFIGDSTAALICRMLPGLLKALVTTGPLPLKLLRAFLR